MFPTKGCIFGTVVNYQTSSSTRNVRETKEPREGAGY